MRPAAHLSLLAVLYTALNALKPVQIDDAAYSYYARHMAGRPLDPYGFAVFWYQYPEPANHVLVPPVLPYYWALLHALAGDAIGLVKLGLLPWAGLLVWALYALGRRFCRPLAGWLPWLLLPSPLLLPSFNLMLDVPALSLGLAALAVFLRAADRRSYAGAAWAGLLAGLAMQTKYTAFLVPAAMLLYAAVRRRWGLGPVAGLVAAHVFVTWELLTALLYGESHFLCALRDGETLEDKLAMLPFLPSLLGGVTPAWVLLGLAALGARRRWLALAAGAALGGYALVASVDVYFEIPPLEFGVAEVVFDLFAGALTAVLGGAVWALRRGEGRGARRRTAFLLLWLGLEVLGYAALTPFPAVRRVLGVGVVVALLLARLAARTCRGPRGRRTLAWVAAGNAALGLAFFALDCEGARAQQAAVEGAAAWVADQGGGTAWFVGHWGFQYYAERAGMRPAATTWGYRGVSYVPLPGPSSLREGDWLVTPPDERHHQQSLRRDPDKLELRVVLEVPTGSPLRTVPCFYGGGTAVKPQRGPLTAARVYRVTADFTPAPR